MRKVLCLMLVVVAACAKHTEVTVVATADVLADTTPTAAKVAELPIGARLDAVEPWPWQDKAFLKVEKGFVARDSLAAYPIPTRTAFVIADWAKLGTDVQVASVGSQPGMIALVEGGVVTRFIPATDVRDTKPTAAELVTQSLAAIGRQDLAAGEQLATTAVELERTDEALALQAAFAPSAVTTQQTIVLDWQNADVSTSVQPVDAEGTLEAQTKLRDEAVASRKILQAVDSAREIERLNAGLPAVRVTVDYAIACRGDVTKATWPAIDAWGSAPPKSPVNVCMAPPPKDKCPECPSVHGCEEMSGKAQARCERQEVAENDRADKDYTRAMAQSSKRRDLLKRIFPRLGVVHVRLENLTSRALTTSGLTFFVWQLGIHGEDDGYQPGETTTVSSALPAIQLGAHSAVDLILPQTDDIAPNGTYAINNADDTLGLIGIARVNGGDLKQTINAILKNQIMDALTGFRATAGARGELYLLPGHVCNCGD